MSILIHSQHYHDAEGTGLFPSLVDEARAIVSRFAGFLTLRRLVPLAHDGSSPCHLLVEFADEASWNAWASSPEHDHIAAKIMRTWTRPPDVRMFMSE